jgi:hypothetical protein
VTRVLFIGNSFTTRNVGVDRELEILAPSIRTTRITHDGYTLRDHWLAGNALATIRAGGWDCVVLQEQSVTAVLSQADFFHYGTVFNDEIVRSGARTVLLETWQRPDAVAAGVTSQTIEAAYTALGASIGATVAPAGAAFAAALAGRPGIELNLQDGHPTPAGTYLAACAVYGAILGRTPVGNVAADPALPTELQAYLQGEAARALGY